MNKIKTGFLTFEAYHKRKDIGSSRIRAFNICNKWQEAGPDIGEAKPFVVGEKYDAVVYQKVYWVDHAKAYKGFKILDMCDPDFLHWGYPIQEMIQNVDVITVSSPALEEKLKGITDKPVYLVNDGIMICPDDPIKLHKGKAKKVVWYGYAENFPLLDACMPALNKLDLELIVISSKPYVLTGAYPVKITNYPWSINWKKDIVRGDIVLNPTLKTGKWKYKSNNKTTQAWALGMPVASSEEELTAFVDETNRQKEAEKRLTEVFSEWTTERSVEKLKEIISKHYDSATR
jgi:hypothetical protein